MDSHEVNSYEAPPSAICPQCAAGCSVFDLRCPQCNTDLSVTTLIRRPRIDASAHEVPEIRFNGTEERLWPGAIIGRAGIGRSALDSDLTVSRRHLQILKMEDRWFLQQLPDTRSACLFDGTPITQGEVVEITRGNHSLEFNSVSLELSFAPRQRPSNLPKTPAPSTSSPQMADGGVEKSSLSRKTSTPRSQKTAPSRASSSSSAPATK